ncbi:MAG: DUF4921 family protein [Patescibacteria group bacterium]
MSDLRQDPVSKDWIIIAPGRAQRPHVLVAEKKKKRYSSPQAACPFEDLEKSGNWPPILSYPNEKKWEAVVIPNKYPALVHREACPVFYKRGPYELTSGIGHHDLLVTRNHTKNIADLPIKKAVETFQLLQKRYRILSEDKCLVYASSFFNWGPSAGASVTHPHYQVLTLPIIPPHIQHSLDGSRDYFRKHHKCVHCAVIRYEIKEKSRVIGENRHAVAVNPFVSQNPFEIRIFPKRHLPFFEKTSTADIQGIVALLQQSIRQIRKHLKDPDFNFFIHTAPIKKQNLYRYYHWHIELVPKVSIPAGFELSTGVEINAVDPNDAAALFRKK